MIDKPNYTQIPNIILDDFIMCMGDAEFKVVMAIARQTFGYHRERHKMSLAALRELTGLSKQGVLNGVAAGMERGVIDREADGDSYTYAIVITDSVSQRNGVVNEVDKQGSPRNGHPVVHEMDTPSQRSRPPLVNEVDRDTPALKKDLKKDLKKRERKTSGRKRPAESAHPNTRPILDAYVEALGYKPGNYGQEAKAAKQLAKEGYEPSDVAAAYALLKEDAFWRTKHLSLQTLVKEMPAMRHALLQGVPLQKQVGKAAVDRNQIAADQVRQALRAHGKENILRG